MEEGRVGTEEAALLCSVDSCHPCRLLTMIGELGKQYVIWQEPFDNGVQVCTVNVCVCL